MLLRFLELHSDDQVVRKLKSALYPQALSDKLDTTTQTIAGLTSQLESKECRITVLEDQVELLQRIVANEAKAYTNEPDIICGVVWRARVAQDEH
ncbi:hypothetical protein NP493_884g01007 [Ridgeia piscesae]|uniref:Uncharacterized protein n=1 Tax=Ridgeia piscesae TaxID=27915 RepID=A0AAD9NK59_RIDPI|nr:hypothetical protein NP493_884g01007 [Ridgeia piscesae]